MCTHPCQSPFTGVKELPGRAQHMLVCQLCPWWCRSSMPSLYLPQASYKATSTRRMGMLACWWCHFSEHLLQPTQYRILFLILIAMEQGNATSISWIRKQPFSNLVETPPREVAEKDTSEVTQSPSGPHGYFLGLCSSLH
jgi:hypothetical protein